MKKRNHHVLISALLYVLLSLLALEAALRFIDPSGIYRYYGDFNALMSHAIPARDGYRFIPGNYDFAMYSAIIGTDGLRAVPESRQSDCRIAFLGDSVTFGMGSSLSFVDVLARDIDARVINAGFPGYSAANVLAELDTIPADGYAWLIIQNDDDPPFRWKHPTGNLPSAMMLYLGWLMSPIASPPGTVEQFTRYADGILARDDILAFVFDDGRLTPLVAERYPQVVVIPNYHSYVSKFDVHPSKKGADEIARAMHDAVMEFVKRRCQWAVGYEP